MKKFFVIIASILGAIAVMLGAFGAHALKTKLAPELLQTFETAVRYQFYHVFALLFVGLMYKEYKSSLLVWAGRMFIVGIILFSGSLYFLCSMPAQKWLGAITPFGGLCLITGWLLLCFSATKKN